MLMTLAMLLHFFRQLSNQGVLLFGLTDAPSKLQLWPSPHAWFFQKHQKAAQFLSRYMLRLAVALVLCSSTTVAHNVLSGPENPIQCLPSKASYQCAGASCCHSGIDELFVASLMASWNLVTTSDHNSLKQEASWSGAHVLA